MQGNGYFVTWAFGHLVQPAMPETYGMKGFHVENLPVIPDPFILVPRQVKTENGYKPDAGVLAQIKIIGKLFDSSERIIVATDAGREGELIFRYLYAYLGCRKPFDRLWISSLTDTAIREGLLNLRDGKEYDNLYHAAKARSEADWLVGINGTQALTIAAGRGTYSVGRVQTPTLGMVCERYWEHKRFESKPFWQVHFGVVDADSGNILKFTSVNRWTDKATATDIYNKVKDTGSAIITKVATKRKVEKAPLLYDLTTLQRDANRILGFTAQQTLDYLQSLYEKKLCTYPRTDSRYLTSDMADGLPALVSNVAAAMPKVGGIPLHVNAAQVINDKKVSDHHAVIPTANFKEAALTGLPAGERAVLELVALRLLCAVSQPHEYTETAVTLECAGHSFSAKGCTVMNPGWRALMEAHYSGKGENETSDAAKALPPVDEGQTFTVHSAAVKEGKTTPPKHYTEDTLLSAMEVAGAKEMPEDAERKGLGTPATRAAILEKLVATGFVERKKSKKTVSLIPTHAGISLITVLPEQLQSPLMTAEWEHRLKEIERGEEFPETFMQGIRDMVCELVKTYKTVLGADVLFPSGRAVVGKCPRCGSDVTESKKGYFCERNDCHFGLWRDNRFLAAKKINLTKKMAETLLKDGKTYASGIFSEKTGKTYDAYIVLEDDGQRSAYKLEFSKESRK